MMSKRPQIVMLFCLAVAALVMNACAASLPSSNLKGATTYSQRMDLRTGKYQRSYRIHLPSGYDGKAPLPLVVVLHGAFDTGKGMEKVSGFSQLADREKFFVLYPEGIGIMGFLQHWNAGHCCGKAAKDNINDVGYLASAITDVCKRLSVDQSRIYMVGFSNGGMMTYRFAAEHTDMLAAAVPMAASIGGRLDDESPIWRIPQPEHTLPIMIIHGLNDEDVPYQGGKSIRKKDERSYLSVRDSLQFWLEVNGCNNDPVLSYAGNGSVTIQRWNECTNATTTVLCAISNWGHIWPGPAFTSSLQKTDPMYNFDIADLIWDFIKQFRGLKTQAF
jgi:polyhydroxybutyrate depolymerase